MSAAVSRAALVTLGALGVVLALLLLAQPAAAQTRSEAELLRIVTAAAAEADRTGKPLVHFDGGFWDNTTNEAYIDEGGRVARLVDGKLAAADPGIDQPPPSGTLLGARTLASPPPICSDTTNLTHCEQVVDRAGCRPAGIYDNYVGDDFRGQFASVWPGTYINVRNAPYRRYGPRGVRVFYNNDWGFMSGNCLTGGL